MFRIGSRDQGESSASHGPAWQPQWESGGGPEHKVNPGKIKPGLLSQLPLTSPLLALRIVSAKNWIQVPGMWARGNYHLRSPISFLPS